jgi:hypothetical protein
LSYSQPLDVIPLWAFFLLTLAIVYASVEGGIRLGRYRRRISEAEKETTIGPIVGATMGLLAFMLAFTFGLAASRFDARRKATVDEANAVGTTYLRAGLLEEPHRSEVRGLLRRYVDGRLAVLETGDVAKLQKDTAEVHERLWSQAEAIGRTDPHSITGGLFIESLNQTIDMHSTRFLIAVQSRIPSVLWITLYLTAVFSMSEIGYHAGLTGSSRSPAVAAMAITFTVVLLLIADLDRPREGLIRVDQHAFVELRDAWKNQATPGRQ